MATYSEYIPLIKQLDRLINAIAFDEASNQTGLCGIWQDVRSGDEIMQDIVKSRTQAREIVL